GKVYILLSQRGEVEILESLISRKEAAKQERSEEGTKATRPEITSPLRNYLDLHRHAAVRATLIDHPAAAFRLMLAHAITSAGHWNVQAEPQRSDNPATAESVETSSSETLFDGNRRTVLALLEFDPEAPTVMGAGRRCDPMTLFQRLLDLTDEEVMAVAAVGMGETLAAGSMVVDSLGLYLSVDMASLWQADEAFFELVRDKQVIAALVAEVAGTGVATANAGETGKVMKGIIRDCLAGENGRQKVESWVPRWLRFPEGSYRSPAATESETEAEAAASEGITDAALDAAPAAEAEGADANEAEPGAGEDDLADAEPEAIAAE
ncbi:MAG: chromosome partitioning protein ParB, partial [Alphaproteobacteria bacterium]|nr:chromosome partitioning protein ParB [Alphaproteobacteria bacterium]